MNRRQLTTLEGRLSNGTPDGEAVTLDAYTAHDLDAALTAGDPRELLAITTTLLRGETLMDDGYTITATHRSGVFTVAGEPTLKSRRTGELEEHGPYTVDAVAGTCTCKGFAGRGACKHLTAVRLRYQGRAQATAAGLTRGLLGLVAEGGRLYCRYQSGKPLIVAFRREEDALRERSAAHLIDGEPVLALTQVGALTLDALMADGRYAGVLLVSGAQQTPIWFGAETGPVEPEALNTNPAGRDQADRPVPVGLQSPAMRRQIERDFD